MAHLGGASWTTFAVGAVALVLLFTFDRVPRVPGGLVVLAAGIVTELVSSADPAVPLESAVSWARSEPAAPGTVRTLPGG